MRCKSAAGRSYTGAIATLTLENCRDVHVENARLGKLVATNSSVELERVSIDSSDVAMDVRNSFITATVLNVTANGVALSLDDSQLDLAGASIRTPTRGIHMITPSAIYFSVSDMQAPEYSGDLHKIWNSRTMSADRRRSADNQNRDRHEWIRQLPKAELHLAFGRFAGARNDVCAGCAQSGRCSVSIGR